MPINSNDTHDTIRRITQYSSPDPSLSRYVMQMARQITKEIQIINIVHCPILVYGKNTEQLMLTEQIQNFKGSTAVTE